MDETTAAALHAWEGFYVIVGTSAGALTGLQFIVLTLITEAGAVRDSGESLGAFGAPNVVHFSAALVLSAVFGAPWLALGPPGIAAALCGIFGLVYCLAVLRRAQRQRDYEPVFGDWIWFVILPMLVYAALVVAGVQLARGAVAAAYVVGGVTLTLVLIGIHNAWDTVAYVTVERARERKAREASSAPEPSAPFGRAEEE